MAQRRAKPKFEFKGVVQCELSEADKLKYKLWREDGCDLENLTLKCAEDGYKLTLSYDDYNRTHQAVMMPKVGIDHDCEGYMLTGRGGNPIRALAQLMYKHWVMLEGYWRNNLTKSSDQLEDWE